MDDFQDIFGNIHVHGLGSNFSPLGLECIEKEEPGLVSILVQTRLKLVGFWF